MPKAVKLYVRYVEAVTYRVGRFAMYLIFAMLGVLLYSSIMKTFFLPSLWTLETAQFLMVAYYMLGGGYSMQMNSHVRMDLLYGRWSPKSKGFSDSVTSFGLVFYLIFVLGALYVADQGRHEFRHRVDGVAGHRHLLQGSGAGEGRNTERRAACRRVGHMSYEMIALLMFAAMMLMLLTGQRVFGAIGIVAVVAALALWGDGGSQLAFSAAMKLMKWYPLLTLPLFIYMGFMLSESKIADDLYHMFHVWMGPLNGGLAIGTIILMVVISAMNGLRAFWCRPASCWCSTA
jgi:TRAP-type C4-dicarboxylate transport system permease small subunit